MLSVIPFLSGSVISNDLKTEVLSYLTKAMDVSMDFDMLEWWKSKGDALSHRSLAAKNVLFSRTTFVSCIWTSFSLLVNSSEEKQNNYLENYVETSVMLQYKEHQVHYDLVAHWRSLSLSDKFF